MTHYFPPRLSSDLEQRLEPVEQDGQVEGRRGVGELECVSRLEGRAFSLWQLDVEVALSHHVAEPQLGAGPLGQVDVARHREGDLCETVLGDLDTGDGADLHPRDAYVVPLVEAARAADQGASPEERRGGKGCVSAGKSWGSPE